MQTDAQQLAAAVAADEARRIVSSQSAEYADYLRSVGGAVAAAPARNEPTRQAAGRISTPGEEKPAAAKEAPKDQLRLAKPDDAKGARSAAGDDAAAKDKALREAQDRIAALEKEIAELKSDLSAGDLFSRDPSAFQAKVAALEAAEKTLAEVEDEWLAAEMRRQEIEG